MNLALLDQGEILNHANIISKAKSRFELGSFTSFPTPEIGEKIKLQTEEAAEDSRQRAIRCTKEVVEREESERREEELSKAREKWQKEKQQFFQEAHQNQLRAIAQQTALSEERLEEEFKERLAQSEVQNREHLQRAVQSTWEEAKMKMAEAVANARSEEHRLAKEESKRVANRVVQEKREMKQVAEEEKIRALDDHTRVMEDLCRQALAEQQRNLGQQHDANSKEMCEEYESRLSELKQQSSEQEAEIKRLRNDLEEMTESRNDWKLKYRNLRVEFADFIDQFPGFRAEFIMK